MGPGGIKRAAGGDSNSAGNSNPTGSDEGSSEPKKDSVVDPVAAFAMHRNYFGLFPVELKFFSVAEKHKWRDDVHLHTLVKADVRAIDLFL